MISAEERTKGYPMTFVEELSGASAQSGLEVYRTVQHMLSLRRHNMQIVDLQFDICDF